MKKLFGLSMVSMAGIAAVCAATDIASAAVVVLVDPGFENYAVSTGGYVKPTSGPWTFTNDGGVVEPISPNSSTGVNNTWSATRPAIEGAQYVSTYAALDRVRQTVTFDTPGWYQLSVQAFAPGGTLSIPGSFSGPLVDGQFQFVFDNALYGPAWTVPAGQDWTSYSTFVSVATAGNYLIGMGNTAADPYFINYDAFSVVSVPEPNSILGLASVVLMARRRRLRS